MSIIIKIGGSNLRNSSSLISVKDVVARYDQPVVLVVSAFNGLTDAFFELIRNNAITKNSLNSFLGDLRNRYQPIFESHFPASEIREALEQEFDKRLEKLGRKSRPGRA